MITISSDIVKEDRSIYSVYKGFGQRRCIYSPDSNLIYSHVVAEALNRNVSLAGADLRGADLRHIDLGEADFRGADLTGTCLDPRATFDQPSVQSLLDAGLCVQGVVDEYVLGWRTEESAHVGNTTYIERPEPYVAPWFSVDTLTSCHPGIYLASERYVRDEYPGWAVVPVRCLRSEMLQAGTKFRCKRLWVVGPPRKFQKGIV